MGAWNGDLPHWAVRTLIATLLGALSIITYWVRDLPALPARVEALEQAHVDLRTDIRSGFRDLAQRIDRLMEQRGR